MKALQQFLLVFCFSTISLVSLAQINPKIRRQLYPKYYINGADALCTPTVNCDPKTPPVACGNFIVNNTFTPSSAYNPSVSSIYLDPFTTCTPPNYGYVPYWEAAQGDPMIDDLMSIFFYGVTVPPPFAGTGYALMACFEQSGVPYNEGIAQKIPALTPGNKYCLSFFKKLSIDPNYPNALADFNIVLMHCSDFPSIYPPTIPSPYLTPAIPANSQIIYCETGMGDQSWKQKITSFVANGNYDMIWIFPKAISGPDYEVAVDFSYPELINVNGFTAGSNPNPTPGNCTVTIGPSTPNLCTVKNAVFTWTHTKPDGTLISITAPANQQIQVDAANIDNVGTWTLTMTAPGVTNTNNTCSQPLSASVNVPLCNPTNGIWPKAYSTIDGLQQLIKDNHGDIILATSGIVLGQPTYNHSGVFPSSSLIYSNTFQYTSAGVTNWTRQYDLPLFPFNSGVIQMQDYTNTQSFVDGPTGNIASAPLSLAPFEKFIAETNSGATITMLNNQFKVYTSSGTVLTPYNCTPFFCRFNPNTNNLFVLNNAASNNCFTVYHFNGTGLIQAFTTNLSFFNSGCNPIQIDNNDNFYFVDLANNNTLTQYNYLTGIVSTVSIPGFNNQNLGFPTNNDIYAEDKCLMLNQTDNYIYLLDFANMNSNAKKTLTSGINSSYWFIIDGNSAYIAGYNYTAAQIGNQNIPQLSPTTVPIFITKLSLQNDFTLRQQPPANLVPKVNEPSFAVSVFPTPVSSNDIYLNITTGGKPSLSPYSVIVNNFTGKALLEKKQYLSGTPLNIGALSSGTYYLVVVDQKGERVSKSIIRF